MEKWLLKQEREKYLLIYATYLPLLIAFVFKYTSGSLVGIALLLHPTGWRMGLV